MFDNCYTVYIYISGITSHNAHNNDKIAAGRGAYVKVVDYEAWIKDTIKDNI